MDKYVSFKSLSCKRSSSYAIKGSKNIVLLAGSKLGFQFLDPLLQPSHFGLKLQRPVRSPHLLS